MAYNLQEFTEKIYETLVQEYFRQKGSRTINERINILKGIYYYAWKYPFGRFSDQRLELELEELYTQIPFQDGRPKECKNNRVLHVISSFYNQGGHNKLLLAWIENDKKNGHDILITNQLGGIPGWIREKLSENSVKEFYLDASKDDVVKVINTLEIFVKGYNTIVLYTNPDDIIPVIAAFHKNLPPVIIYNHADHLMWPGISCADAVINFRKIGEAYTFDFRKGRKSYILPFLLEDIDSGNIDSDAKKRAGVDGFKYCAVAVASEYKLRPFDKRNFYELIRKLSDKYSETVFVLIGPTESDWHRAFKFPIPLNVKLKGVVSPINDYLEAADFYLDTFPLSGALGIVEGCRFGAIPVFYKYASEISGVKTVFDYSETLPPGEKLFEYDFFENIELDNAFNDKVREIHREAIKKFNSDRYVNKAKWLTQLYLILTETQAEGHKIKHIGTSVIDKTFNSKFLNTVLVRNKGEIYYFILKSGFYAWLSIVTKLRLNIQRFLNKGLDLI